MESNEQSPASTRRLLKKIPLRAAPFPGWEQRIHGVLFGFFILSFALAFVRLWIPRLLPDAHWPDGLLVVLATAATLGSLARRLPAQNVLLAAVIIAIIGGGLETLGALTGIPFGPYTYSYENVG